MADNTIIQKITLEGGKEIEASLKAIGKTGEDSFAKLNASANNVSASKNLHGLGEAAKSAGSSTEAAAVQTAHLANVMDTLGSTSKEAAKDAKGLSHSAADAISGIKGLGNSSDQAGAAVGQVDVGVIRFSQTLRLLSRAAGIRPLGQFARTLGILGRAFEIAAPALFLSFLEKIAASASKAVDAVADLAAKNKVSFDSFQEFAGGFTAVGLGAEDAGKTFSAFTSIIKETATNTAQNAKEFAKLKDQIEESSFKLSEMGKAFTDLDRSSFRAMRDIKIEQRDFVQEQLRADRDFAQSIADIERQRQDILSGDKVSPEEQRARKLEALDRQQAKLQEANLQRSIKAQEEAVKLREKEEDAVRKQREETFKLLKQQRDEEKQLREQKKAMADAAEAAERNSTVLEKMSIVVLDSNRKLLKTPEVLESVADALSRMTDETKIAKIENELVAAGLDRHLIPTYKKGAAAVRALNAEGLRIRPKFSDKDKEVADEFLKKIGQTEASLGTLKNLLGVAVAPAFIKFFERLTELFISLQPSIKEFGGLINSFLTPLLEGLAVSLTILIDGIGGALNLFAKLFNSIFGTNLTTVQVFAGVLFALAITFGGLPTKIILAIAAFGQFFEAIEKAFGLGEFGKTVLRTLAFLTLAFFVFGGKIVTVFLGIGAFITNIIGFLIPIAPILVVLGLAALAFFAIWKNWDVIKEPALKAFNTVLDFGKKFWADFKVGWTNFINDLTPLWNKLVEGAKLAFEGVVTVYNNVLLPAFQGIKKAVSDLADFLGIKLSSTQIIIFVLIGSLAALAAAFAPVTAAIIAILVVGGLLVSLWKNNSTALTLLGISVAGFLFLLAPWTTIIGGIIIATGFLIAKWDKVKAAVKPVIDFLRTEWDAFGIWFAGTWLGKMISAIDALIDKFRELARTKQTKEQAIVGEIDAGIGSNLTKVEAAGGGWIRGRGTSTSDSIPAWLSDGEYVTRTKAVNYYGRNFMNAINQMRIPKGMFRGFNLGGLVEGLGRRHFAMGGVVSSAGSSLHPVNIHFGNGQIVTGLLAPEKVAESLMRAAVHSQIRSVGRKPSYYGKGR